MNRTDFFRSFILAPPAVLFGINATNTKDKSFIFDWGTMKFNVKVPENIVSESIALSGTFLAGEDILVGDLLIFKPSSDGSLKVVPMPKPVPFSKWAGYAMHSASKNEYVQISIRLHSATQEFKSKS